MKKHAKQKLPCNTRLECAICKKKFKTTNNIARHMQSCAKKKAVIKGDDDDDKAAVVYSCDKCKVILIEKDTALANYEKIIVEYKNQIGELQDKIKLIEITAKADNDRLENTISELKTQRNVAGSAEQTVDASNNSGEVIAINGVNGNVNVTKVVINMPKLSELTPNLAYITEAKFREILGAEFRSLEKLIEEIFFNPEHRENHKLFMDRQNSPDVFMFVAKKWETYDVENLPLFLLDLVRYLIENTKSMKRNSIPKELEQNIKDYYEILKEPSLTPDTKKKKQFEMTRKMIKNIHKLLAHHNQLPITTHDIKGMRKRRKYVKKPRRIVNAFASRDSNETASDS